VSRFHYRAHGLEVESYRPLPGLQPSLAQGETETESPLQVTEDASNGFQDESSNEADGRLNVQVRSREVVLSWRGVGALRIRHGSEIQVALSSPRFADVMGYLITGAGFGAVLHQRRILTLHASSFAIRGGAVALVGAKRAGKSTTAAVFAAQGYPIICDDVLAIRSESDSVSVSPGERIFKLWPNSVPAARVSEPEELPPVHAHTSKRVYQVGESCPERLPLRMIYLLDYCSDADCNPHTESVSSVDAYLALTANTYALQFLGNEGAKDWHVRSLAHLVQTTPVRRLRRPPDLDRVEEVVACVEEDVGVSCPPSL